MKKTLLSLLLCLSISIVSAQEKPGKEISGEKHEEYEENESPETELKHNRALWNTLLKKEKPNYFKVEKLFKNYFKKHPEENSKPKQYCADWLKTQLFYLDNKNRVVASPKTNYNSIRSFAPGVLASVTDTMAGDWHMLGPRNVYETTYSAKGNNGGYVSLVRIDPTNPNKLFISFQCGGLWVSSNGGTVWQLTDANMPDQEYIDIDVCKGNNSYVYAISLGAVIKSTDGGLTWSTTSLNLTNYPGHWGYDIAVSPTDPNIVVARWNDKLYRTTDGGTTWNVVKSGLKVHTVWGGSGVCSELLDFHPTNNNIVYLLDYGQNQNNVTIYRSGDAGATFTTLGQPVNVPSGLGTAICWSKILTATNNPAVFYLAMDTGNDTMSPAYCSLFKLDATTGAILQTRVNMADLGHGDITMDLNNENNIVYGKYGETKAFYSTNNGATFIQSSTTVHADLRAFSMVNGKVLMGTDGEATCSANGGLTFTSLSATISNHELWGFGAAHKSDILGAGLNHGPLMIREHEGAGGWYNALGADQGNTDVNPLDAKYLYSQGYGVYNVERTGPHVMKTTGSQIDPGGIYSYFNSMEFHPNLYYTLITHHASTYKNSLIRSSDNGVTIDKIVKTFTNQVFREKICKTNPNYMYVVEGLSNNKLWKTTDGGTNWVDITASTAVTGIGVRNISDIAVSDVNPNEVWVTYSGVQNTCQVLHSTDGGISYTNLTTPVLTSFPVTKIIFQRGTNGGVYIGNKSGIFYRNNSLGDWVKLGTGLPMLDVRFMFVNYYKNKLMIGTSRGAWDHDLYEHSNTMAQISAEKDSVRSVYDKVQFRDYSVVRKGPNVSYSWSFPGGTPATSTMENPVVSYATEGNFDVTLTVTDQYGTNTQTLPGFIKVLPSECAGVDSVAGRSLSLPDATDKAVIQSLPLNTNTITITAWVKPTGNQANGTGIILQGGITGTGLYLKGTNNTLGCVWGGNYTSFSGFSLPQNQWHHIALVVTPVNLTLYVDGRASTISGANPVIDLTLAPWYIGINGGSNFNGEVDELCIYNRSLTKDEVREKMHLTRPASEPGLVGYYQFNEPRSRTYNLVGTGSEMLLTGGAKVVSSAPVAAGVSQTLNVNNPGIFDFDQTGAKLTYDATGAYPKGTVVVSKLNGEPFAKPTGGTARGNYWILRSFDDPGGAPTPLKGMQLSFTDPTKNFTLNKRSITSVATWFPIPGFGTKVNSETQFSLGTSDIRNYQIWVTQVANAAPTFTVPGAISINKDAAGAYNAATTITGVPTAVNDDYDVSPIISYTDAIAEGSCGGELVITRTWSVADHSGLFTEKEQVITVKDTIAPVIVGKSNAERVSNQGACTYSIAGDEFDASATDESSVTLSYSLTGATTATGYQSLAGQSFNSGVTTVEWTAKDPCGNSVMTSFTVTVADTQAPVAQSPERISLCNKADGFYSINDISASDNCGIQSVVYQVSGATSRTGSGLNASGQFNEGESTVLWTITDNAGNTTTTQTTVNVDRALIVSVADVHAVNPGGDANTIYIGYGPSSLTLTAAVMGGTAPYTYSWSTGARTESAVVNPNKAGVHDYTVTITDALGCTATTIAPIKVRDIRSADGKINICHNDNSLSISVNAVAAHLKHGDKLGNCGADALEANASGAGIAVAYPNPFTNELKIQLSSALNGQVVNYEIYSVLYGNLVHKSTAVANAGFISIAEASALPPGQYVIKTSFNTEVYSVQVVKQ
ncbi:LamG-like jellyroll fold domain-containing protein [Solitalea koreensis]|uniref:Por secretion system C-terminal sorting domain-containing protein n=1 Tax=Solitalea koreensis TaxID=543615 RepID=A0A521AVH0_9SPHI|nr:LamG-like jellyroll fold domain-containing protein [Solitalea koreensis]SMO38711.1 Por secretion system C-terminal sorting domain-containing protein [Solitalea koreensis]